jgi:hypothetical protein
MAKRRIAGFEFVVYKNDDKIEVAFNKAKRVPKAYANFIATLELGCLVHVNKVVKGVDNGKDSAKLGTTDEQ